MNAHGVSLSPLLGQAASAHHIMAHSTIRDFLEFPSPPKRSRAWSVASATSSLAAIVIAVAALGLSSSDLSRGVLLVAIAILCVIFLVHARFLVFAREQNRQTNQLLWSKDREFQSFFENALDAILVFDDNGVCQDANPSFSELLSCYPDKVVGQPVRLFYLDPREFDATWNQLLANQRCHGEAKLARLDGTSLFAEFTATLHFLPHRHLMVFRDITQRHRAQLAVNQSLVLARSSLQEADTMRRATLALTRDLRMDRVLDVLLETLATYVPYEKAQLHLLEADSRLFLAREAPQNTKSTLGLGFPETFELSKFPILAKVFHTQNGLLLEDALHEGESTLLGEESRVRSWMGVSIASSNQILGVLAVAHSVPDQFSPTHLRLTRSLATSAGVAIQNARLYERAEIYGSELEHRISELNRVERTLQQAELVRHGSEDRFQKVFRAVPVAISVTSLADGRFIEVNETFERRFGFTREEVLGRTSIELGFWDNPQERSRLIEQIRGGARVRDAVVRLRTKSGLVQPTLCSVEVIELDDQPCLLVATEDLPHCPPGPSN